MSANSPTELDHLARLASMERLSESLSDRDGGTFFQKDLAEATELATRDPRFEELVDGLTSPTLGGRLAAINDFFSRFDPDELSGMSLPPHLGQLRTIHLMSR